MGLFYAGRLIGKKVSKQAWKLAIKQASMQVSRSNQVHRLIVLSDM